MNPPVVQWFDRSSVDTCVFDSSHESQFLRRYWVPMMRGGAQRFTANLRADLGILKVDEHLLPVTINEANYDSSYVCSPYTHFVSYAIYELQELKTPWLERVLWLMLSMLGVLLRWSRINRVVHINNWLLSTNLYPNLTPAQLDAVVAFVRERFPDHAMVFRSLNERTCGGILQALDERQMLLVATRQVYVFPGVDLTQTSKRQRRELRRDRALLAKHGYACVPQEELSEADIDRCLDLYNALYIEKYSDLNPQFTREWMELTIRQGAMRVFGLKRDGQVDAVLGYFHIDGVLTTPLFGYDTTVPQPVGLYRMLSALTLQEAFDGGLIDHASSGVADFKRNRGYLPAVEYSAVETRHLSLRRRIGWRLLEIITRRVAVPLITRFGL